MNVAMLLHDVVRKVPNKTALIEAAQEISYEELWARVERLAAAFCKKGITAQSRVALILPNSSEFIYCFFALLKIEAIVSPLSPELTPYEVKIIFKNLNPHAIICLPDFISKVFNEFPELFKNKILVSQGDSGVNIGKRHYNLKELYQENYKIGNTIRGYSENVATINYTYRGLGYPLGAILTHSNYAEDASAYAGVTKISAHHRVLSLLPLSHVFTLVGCVLVPLLQGATVVISRNYLPRAILQSIDALNINYLTAVPSIYALLLQHYKKEGYNLTSLSCCISGGAYMREELLNDIKANICSAVLQGYGLTECLALTWAHGAHNKEKALGSPLREDFKIKVVGSNGVCKRVNEIGEIIVSAPTIMRGYYNQSEETRTVFKTGWFCTGDYGYIDEHGYLQFAGMKKNVAKVGGNMVDLKEVQNILLAHPLIIEASVFAKEDRLWGHIIEAEIVPMANVKLAENEIKTFCFKRLSRYKIPKAIRFVTEVTQK